MVLVAGGGLLLAVQAAGLAAGGELSPRASAAAWVLGAAAAGAAALAAARRVTDAHTRLSWALWACAAGAWLAGAVLRGLAPTGSSVLFAADALWWLFALLAAAGIALRIRGSFVVGLVALDAAALALLATALALVVQSEPPGARPVNASISTALYAFLLFVALQIVVAARRTISRSGWLVLAACGVSALAALAWGARGAGGWADLLWTASMLLLALGGAQRLREDRDAAVPVGGRRERALWSLPLALALAGLVALLLVAEEDGHPVLLGFLVAAILAVAGRFHLLGRGTQKLLGTLRRSEEALRASERRYRSLFASEAIGVVVADLDGRVVEGNAAFAAMLRYEPGELAGTAIAELTHPEDVDDTRTVLGELRAGTRDGAQLEKRYRRRDGSTFWGRVSVSLVRDEHGEPAFLLGLIEDVSDRRQAEERFRRLLETAPDAMVIVDAEGRIAMVNQQTETLFGFAREELLGRPIEMLVPERFRARHAAHRQGYVGESRPRPMGAGLELLGRRRNGHEFPVEISLSPLVTDQGTLVSAAIRDATDRKQLEEELRRKAFHDSLTGLANRALFHDRAEHALARRRGEEALVALLLLDLDDFKSVNDTLGHQAGDQLLTVVAERLRACLRAADTCARLGGDEFAVLLEELSGEEPATRTAERILESLAAPVVLSGEEVIVRASIGVAFGTPGSTRPGDLLRDADIALYRAKRSPGAPRFALFQPEMLAGLRNRRRLASELSRALEREELRVFYQPIVSLADGSTAAVEALVRWQHPQRGLIAPGEFIGVAEETELIVPLTRLVLAESCRQVRRWQLEHPSEPPLSLSVNVSGVCLAQAGLVADVERSLDTAGLAAASLTLELTETSLIRDLDGERRLDELKEIGVRLGVDDFGAGHSSLTYLRSFPIDVLKIDKSFTERLDVDERDARFVETIVRLASALGVATVAEGVEREEQRLRLLRLGCSFGQGYRFAKPLPPEAFARRLRAEREGRATDAA